MSDNDPDNTSRRKFLKYSGLGAAGVGFTPVGAVSADGEPEDEDDVTSDDVSPTTVVDLDILEPTEPTEYVDSVEVTFYWQENHVYGPYRSVLTIGPSDDPIAESVNVYQPGEEIRDETSGFGEYTMTETVELPDDPPAGTYDLTVVVEENWPVGSDSWGFSQEQTIEDVILLGEAFQPPEIVSASLPRTACEIWETTTYSLVVDPGSVAPEEIEGRELTTFVDKQGGPDVTAPDIQELDSGQLELEWTIPSGFDEDLEEGDGIEGQFSIRPVDPAEADWNSIVGPWFMQFFARDVDTIACVPAVPSNVDVPGELDDSPVGDELFDYLREKAEFVNHHYCSGLGSMGGIAFDFRFLTDNDNESIEKGWLILDKPEDEYDDGPGSLPDKSQEFTEDTASKIENGLNIEIGAEDSEFDTLFVVGRHRGDPEDGGDGRYSRPYYRGELWPDGVDICIGSTVFPRVCIDSEVITSRFDNVPGVGMVPTPVETPSGYIDAIYETEGRNAWRHELGHSLGPNNQVGFPDLYGDPPAHLGQIGNWGLMGHGEVITSFSRVWGGDLVDNREWLSRDSHLYGLSESVDLTPLTEKTLGDSTNTVWSVYADFSISWKPWDFSLSPAEFHIERYHIEARKDYEVTLDNPDSGPSPIQTTPSPNTYDGIAIYKQDLFSVGDESFLKDLAQGNISKVIDDFIPTTDYLQNADGSTHLPTLTDQGHSSLETHTDTDEATEFELDSVTSDNEYEITINRDVSELLPTGVGKVVEVAASLLSDLIDELLGSTADHSALPPLEVVAETADGDIAGIDPETGEIINQIEGATVTMRGNTPVVRVPADSPVEFTVSANQLKQSLADRDIEQPKEIQYEQTILIDKDPTLEMLTHLDGFGDIPYINGRIRQESVGRISEEDNAKAGLVSAEIILSPERLNVNSQGNWVTAWIGLPEELDASEIIQETVILETVRAEHDESFGFVSDPATKPKNDTQFVQVKFPRDNCIETLGPGEHDVTVSGIADGTSFQGDAGIELFEPGAGKDRNQNN